MIRVSFVPPDLARWDSVPADAICLSFFADERPLRGPAGLADWRLCGALSRCLQKGRLEGKTGEVLLLPTANRLPFQKVFLFGLGDPKGFNEIRYRVAIKRTWEVLRKAKVKRFALAAPGRSRDAISPRRAVEILLQEFGREEADVIVIEPLRAQKEMASALRQARA